MSTVARPKTYVLLDHTRPTAPIYLRVNNNQRARLDTRPIDHAYLQYTCMDENGKNKTCRLKLNCDEIDQAIQIKEHSIPANERFTQREKDAVRFYYGTLTTTNATVQRFLESSPQFDGFKGTRPDDIPRPLYTLHDRNMEILNDNKMFKKRVRGGYKIAELDTLSEAQALMIRLNGSHFEAPKTIEECQNQLASFLDDADEMMLDELLKEELNEDDRVRIIVGKAIQKGTLSFDTVEDQVVRIKNGRNINVKEISSEYSLEERIQYFTEFLTSPKGRLLLNDITNDVEEEKEVVKLDQKPSSTVNNREDDETTVSSENTEVVSDTKEVVDEKNNVVEEKDETTSSSTPVVENISSKEDEQISKPSDEKVKKEKVPSGKGGAKNKLKQ